MNVRLTHPYSIISRLSSFIYYVPYIYNPFFFPQYLNFLLHNLYQHIFIKSKFIWIYKRHSFFCYLFTLSLSKILSLTNIYVTYFHALIIQMSIVNLIFLEHERAKCPLQQNKHSRDWPMHYCFPWTVLKFFITSWATVSKIFFTIVTRQCSFSIWFQLEFCQQYQLPPRCVNSLITIGIHNGMVMKEPAFTISWAKLQPRSLGGTYTKNP